MLALYRCGRQSDALRAFQTARSTLIDEFGVEPGAALLALERAVLDRDPALEASHVPLVPGASSRQEQFLSAAGDEAAHFLSVDGGREARAGRAPKRPPVDGVRAWKGGNHQRRTWDRQDVARRAARPSRGCGGCRCGVGTRLHRQRCTRVLAVGAGGQRTARPILRRSVPDSAGGLDAATVQRVVPGSVRGALRRRSRSPRSRHGRGAQRGVGSRQRVRARPDGRHHRRASAAICCIRCTWRWRPA